ncbi:MAG: hypothetical protein JWN40_4503 [Phycisphaerales bacterium]|nr:hypothetical protein [Phycisphaerales bacterium]
MFLKAGCVCASAVLFCAPVEVSAAIIKTARHASTSNRTVTTTTSGQRSILMTVDPLDVASFQLDVSFEAGKVEFVGITGLNGYVIDQTYEVVTEGPGGQIFGIHGYYPGFNDRLAFQPPVGLQAAAAVTATPPVGEVDIFQVTFLDLAPELSKTFAVFAGPFDYINAYNSDTGLTTTAMGLYDPATDQGVDPAFSTVDGISSVPLPGGLATGLISGAGVLAGHLRRRNGRLKLP